MQLAKAVANAAAALVLRAKNVAQKAEDSAQQNRVIAAATQCALSTSQLVACTRVSNLYYYSLVDGDSQQCNFCQMCGSDFGIAYSCVTVDNLANNCHFNNNDNFLEHPSNVSQCSELQIGPFFSLFKSFPFNVMNKLIIMIIL